MQSTNSMSRPAMISRTRPVVANNRIVVDGVPASVILRLALADLWHEVILSFCMAMALAAVLAPLLLLLGLKYGTIETMRDRLIKDPVYRELKPAQTGNFVASWFTTLRRNPQVQFTIPTILRGAAIVKVFKQQTNQTISMDMVPTAAGDPLLVENGATVPGPDEVVLSTEAGAELDANPGDNLRVQVNRFRGTRQEDVEAIFHVAAILPPRADALPRLYLPSEFTIDVETYRNGMAVAARNWPGGIAAATPSFDGVFVIVETALDPLSLRNVTIGTGFSEVQEISTVDLERRTKFHIGAQVRVYDLHVLTEPSNSAGVDGVRERLRGHDAILIPYTRDLALTLPSGLKLPLVAWSVSDDDTGVVATQTVPWGDPTSSATFEQIGKVLLPRDVPADGGTVTVHVEGMMGSPAIPLRVSGTGPDGVAVVPSTLAGILRTGALREVVYDQAGKTLALGRSGFGGFRLYARTIDDVRSLEDLLRTQDIAVISQSQTIERIRVLDRGLTRMFWLVATVGIIGGAAALIASLYAAVQRKRRELGLMRLMGIPRRSVFLFPIYQSAALAAAGGALGVTGFGFLSAIINWAFAGDLALGQKICRLPPSYVAAAVAGMIIVAVACSLMAGVKTTQIDPAEAIRDE
jgi:putative ABC transport system permease protein